MNDNIDNINIEEVAFTLNIQSNVSYDVDVEVLNPLVPSYSTTSLTQYRYNFTSFTFTTENSLTLQYKLNAAPTFSVYSSSVSSNINSVVAALNNLGIGQFGTYTESGSTYITTYNDTYTFGLLNVYDNTAIPVPPSANFIGEMQGTTGSVNVYVNLAANTYGVPPAFDISIPLPVTATDTIRVNGVASNAVSKKVAYITNLTTGETPYYINLNVGDAFDSGNILVGNNSWEIGYLDY